MVGVGEELAEEEEELANLQLKARACERRAIASARMLT